MVLFVTSNLVYWPVKLSSLIGKWKQKNQSYPKHSLHMHTSKCECVGWISSGKNVVEVAFFLFILLAWYLNKKHTQKLWAKKDYREWKKGSRYTMVIARKKSLRTKWFSIVIVLWKYMQQLLWHSFLFYHMLPKCRAVATASALVHVNERV